MNSIQSQIDPDILANEVRMERATYKGSFLIVEGTSDLRLFKKFTSEEDCKIVPAFSKNNVIGTLYILEDANFKGVVGLVDRDFWGIVPKPTLPMNIVCTDENDVEIMILCSPALSNVIREYGSEEKLTAAEITSNREIRELIFEIASKIGILRILSQLESMNLDFDGMKYHFLTNTSLEIDLVRQVTHVVSRSRANNLPSTQEIVRRVSEGIPEVRENRLLCCGHDCVKILGRAMKKFIGTSNQFEKNDGKDLEKILRLAYEKQFFENTALCAALESWERDSGFRLLSR